MKSSWLMMGPGYLRPLLEEDLTTIKQYELPNNKSKRTPDTSVSFKQVGIMINLDEPGMMFSHCRELDASEPLNLKVVITKVLCLMHRATITPIAIKAYLACWEEERLDLTESPPDSW